MWGTLNTNCLPWASALQGPTEFLSVYFVALRYLMLISSGLVQQRDMVLQVNGALLAPGQWSSCLVSKAKDPLSCQQAGKQKTSSSVGSWIKSTDTVPDSQAWEVRRCSSLCCCRQVFWCLCLWTAQGTHPSCNLLWTLMYPQEEMG